MSLLTSLMDTGVRMLLKMRLDGAVNDILKHAPQPVHRWSQEQKRHRRIRTRLKLVPEKQLAACYRRALSVLAQGGCSSVGDYLEFGVFNGTSMLTCYRVLNELGLNHVRLIGFDTFEGMPAIAATDDHGHWHPGDFKSDYEFTREVLSYHGVDLARVLLVKGLFENTLTDELVRSHAIKRTSLIMMDCDIYSSTKQALEFCSPLIADDGFVFFDDWYPLANKGLGEKRALDEFLQVHPEFQFEPQPETYCEYAKIFRVHRTVVRSVV